MGQLLDRLRAGSPSYVIEDAGTGFVLIRRTEHEDEFSQLVRELLGRNTDEFVILPVSDGRRGYERVVLLPF